MSEKVVGLAGSSKNHGEIGAAVASRAVGSVGEFVWEETSLVICSCSNRIAGVSCLSADALAFREHSRF